ncbi:MAG: NAD(+) diphosphatase [Propionibacteriaceae bacterium]|nr:NAD(+) diphosphatase [Propionibacteriaceae bacterium]
MGKVGAEAAEKTDFDRLGRAARLDQALVWALWRQGSLLDLATLEPRPTTGVPFDPKRHLLVGLVGPGAAEPTQAGTEESDDAGAVFVDRLAEADEAEWRRALPQLEAGWAEAVWAATALWQWHRRETFCPNCGGATTVTAAGAARCCPACQIELFPRTDPAVIVAVRDDADRLLLARQAVWPEGRRSILAGFVEAGETPERAVWREVGEEVGLVVDQIAYAFSQPWPFPRSLMLGFTAHALDSAIVPDGGEIVAADWFTRSQARAAIAQGRLTLPGPPSIAHRLIRQWLDGA